MTQGRPLIAHTGARPIVDVILECVDAFVQSVGQLEVSLRDIVDEVVDDHAG